MSNREKRRCWEKWLPTAEEDYVMHHMTRAVFFPWGMALCLILGATCVAALGQ